MAHTVTETPETRAANVVAGKHDLWDSKVTHPMTPDEQLRMQAMMLADKRKPADATIDDVLREAEKVLRFLKGGVAVSG